MLGIAIYAFMGVGLLLQINVMLLEEGILFYSSEYSFFQVHMH